MTPSLSPARPARRAPLAYTAAALAALAGFASPSAAQLIDPKSQPEDNGTQNQPPILQPGVRPGQSPAQAPGGDRAPRARPSRPEVRPGQPPANGQPAAQPGAGAAPGATFPAAGQNAALPEGGDDDLVVLSDFSEPVELRTLIDLVANTLRINIVVKGDVTGTITFNAPLPVRRSELIDLLQTLLALHNYTLTRDAFGIYTVSAEADIDLALGDDLATTRVIPTPAVRPSTLKTAIEAQLGGGGGQPGAISTRRIAYIDDLGVIVMTDTPRNLRAVEQLVTTLINQYQQSRFTRLELNYVAAPVARQRALQLLGQLQQPIDQGQDPNQQQPQQPQARPGALDRLGERLLVDPAGNGLIFRGLPAEADAVRDLLTLIDSPGGLVPQQHFAGSAAGQIAKLARLRGLGEVTTISSRPAYDPNFGYDPNQWAEAQRAMNPQGGPVMVVDETRGTILYYGTAAQQEMMRDLLAQVDPQSEEITIEVYKLRNSDAEQVAEVILGLIQNSTPEGESPLLPGGSSAGRGSSRRNLTRNFEQNQGDPNNPGAQNAEGSLSIDEEGFVIADVANNQVLVKAPAAQQRNYRRLIENLDLRRPQVYLEAKIVAVTWSDDMRLAFETQLINAGGSGGVINTDFGLGSFPANSEIIDRKLVGSLDGLTAAIIRSDSVPIIINALQTKADTRILSSPQLLVDDNEEAEIVSVDQQPTTSISRTTGNPDVTSFAGYEDAGTTLRITPQISDAGYLRLKYEATLSNFTGDTSSDGIPPPRQENTIRSDSVTVPSGATVVVGGIILDTERDTRIQVPFLGDIPILGLLFQDRRDNDRKTTLYIFLTPRILNDPTFDDLLLLTRGPQERSNIALDVPELTPTTIDINRPRELPLVNTPAEMPSEPAPAQP